MLERFRKAKASEIAELEKLAASKNMPAPIKAGRPSFSGGLKYSGKAPIIAEYKRASPSRGDLNLQTTPEEAAAAYAAAGAGAISVLTEREHFKGDLSYLERAAGAGLPLLRKDFIFHRLQVAQTAATAASALLLIVRMLDEDGLKELLEECRRFSLEAVVEIFDEDDLALARAAGAEIVQVNNRDLDKLALDMTVSERLIGRKQAGEFWISASGIEAPEQLQGLLDLGFDAALVGSSLMQGGDPGLALSNLIGGRRA